MEMFLLSCSFLVACSLIGGGGGGGEKRIEGCHVFFSIYVFMHVFV